MISKIYPPHQQKLFTNRTHELSFLKTIRDDMAKRPRHIAVIGLRKIGKTWLIKEFLKRNKDLKFTYINVEEIISSPEAFVIKCIGKTCYWVFGGNELDYIDYSMISSKNIEIKSKAVDKTLKIYNELINRRRIDYASFLSLLFSFFEELADELKTEIVIVLDEFQYLLTLNKFQNVDALKLYRRYVENALNVSYFISGSAVSLMETILGEDSPLFELFKEISLKNFSREESKKLVKKILPNADDSSANLLYYLTKGHPSYICNTCDDLKQKELDDAIIKTAFITQVLSKEKEIYKHCYYIYKISLKKARGYNNLKLVLQILSQREGMAIGEISKASRKPAPTIQDAVEELVKVDLLKFNEERRIFFIDPVFKFWVGYFELGIEIEDFSTKKTLLELIRDLDVKFQRASTELGIAKEYEVKERLEKKLKTKLENYLSADGQAEFDLVGKKNGTRYLLEVKWRNRPATYGDVKKFVENVGNSEFSEKTQKLFFISKCGFTDNAKSLAKKEGVGLIENL